MKKSTFRNTQLIIGLLIALLIGNNATSQEWELIYTNEDHGIPYEICFIPHNNWQTGWIGFSDGTVIKTIDGGENWVEYQTGSNHINGLVFANENVGYISTADGQIMKSIDGGETWQFQHNDPNDWFNKIDFKDELNGAVGGLPMKYTNDGGVTWNNSTSPYAYDNVDYGSGDTYFAHELWEGKVGKSTDGGQTWTNVHTVTELLVGLDFYDENHGLSGGSDQTMDITNDGGDTWTTETMGSGNGDLLVAAYVDTDTIYAGGSRVYRSIDGGDTWFLELDPPLGAIRSMDATATGVVYIGNEYLIPGEGFVAEIFRRAPAAIEFLSADFMASETEFCEGNTIDFTDLSTGNIQSWEWTFEGGTPATSTEQNPSVTYATPGAYDVELSISDGNIEVSQLKEDYIQVQELPGQAGIPVGDDAVCSNETSVYTSSGAASATSYDWNFSPGNAGTITENGLQATVVWNPSFSGNAFISISGFNACGEGDVSEVLSVTVEGIPMPVISGVDLVCDEQIEEYSVDFNSGNTYVWEVSGGTITEGQGTHMITVSWGEPGDGTVMVTETAASACAGDSELFEVMIDDCTGLFDYENNSGLSIYPNPVSNTLNIKLEEINDSKTEIKIFNSLGQRVFDGKIISIDTSIDISSFPKGLYFLQVHANGESMSQQFIKN